MSIEMLGLLCAAREAHAQFQEGAGIESGLSVMGAPQVLRTLSPEAVAMPAALAIAPPAFADARELVFMAPAAVPEKTFLPAAAEAAAAVAAEGATANSDAQAPGSVPAAETRRESVAAAFQPEAGGAVSGINFDGQGRVAEAVPVLSARAEKKREKALNGANYYFTYESAVPASRIAYRAVRGWFSSPALIVSFEDEDSQRKWKNHLPRTIEGVSVVSAVLTPGEKDRRDRRIAGKIAEAREYFARFEVPGAAIEYKPGRHGRDGHLEVRFQNLTDYRRASKSIPEEIAGLSVLTPQYTEAREADHQSWVTRKVAEVRNYFARQGIAVADVEFHEAGYMRGIPFSGPLPKQKTSWGAHISVSFSERVETPKLRPDRIADVEIRYSN